MAYYTRTGVGRAGYKWTMKQDMRSGMKTWRIEGIENVTAQINARLQNMKTTSGAGLIAAGAEVIRDADRTPPVVPVDTNTLRQSQFVDNPANKKPVTGDPYVNLGYRTNYAAAVHEMLKSPSGKPINWKRPGSGPRFLEASLKRNVDKIFKIIASHTKG